ncbi:MAG: FG-GAP-like repeat-containing protein [Bacteroidia bacterium]
MAFCWLNLSHAQMAFVDVSQQAGITHAFEVDLATFGGGAAVIDFDRDGYEDLYVTGGNAPDVLYRNNGDGTFTNVHDGAGFSRTQEIHTQGVASADINRDGFPDLLITSMNYNDIDRTVAPNLLYLNQGDGTFLDVTAAWGLEDYRSNSMGASFGDINEDGFPDLFIANYYESAPTGISIYNGNTITNSFVPARDYFFINVGGGDFFLANDYYGLDYTGFGFSGLFTDFNNDQHTDIHVVNDFGFKITPNLMLRNDFPEPKLSNRAFSLTLNFGMNAMGNAACDYNNDGWMDYYVSNLGTGLFAISENNGTNFLDGGPSTGLALQLLDDSLYSGVPVSWGANFFDYDHDMDSDLFVSNGALNPDVRYNPNMFFESQEGQFTEKAGELGLKDYSIGRGSVVFDFDKDGDMDIFAVNQKPLGASSLFPEPARCRLFRNDAANGNWIKVELEGIQATKAGLGARIELIVDETLLVKEIYAGSSHLSQNSTIAHFGLGTHTEIQSLTVKWPGGKVQSLENVAVNQQLKILETDTPISYSEDEIQFLSTQSQDGVNIKYQITGSDARLEEIVIFSLDGKRLSQFTDFPDAAGYFFWRPGPSVPAGIYLIHIRTSNGTTAEKVIKY